MPLTSTIPKSLQMSAISESATFNAEDFVEAF